MIDEGIPLSTVAKIVGWAPSTTVHMSTVYGHSRMDKMREAVNAITGKSGGKQSESPSFPPSPVVNRMSESSKLLN